MSLIDSLKEKKFVIPIYQRNYAWTDVEINQLISDINNFKEESGALYHLGTLVVFKKEANEYHVIDGQQRLITLTLILYALEKENNFINLSFEAREENNKVLGFFREGQTDSPGYESNELVYAYKQYIQPKINEFEPSEKESFKKKIISKAALNQNVLPESVNVHHYFERMNTRGKQLELHSVLRAKLLKKLSEDDGTAFPRWDLCANLDEYSDFKKISEGENDKIEFGKILEDLRNNNTSNKNNKGEDKEQSYKAVIDFENFLLIALQLHLSIDFEISLNDKNLLNEFGYYDESFNVEPRKFLDFLVELKQLFDTYIIKRNYLDSPYWILKKKNGHNTFSKDNDDEGSELQIKIVKIQSVLHAIYPSNTNKEWLLIALQCIYENKNSEPQVIGNELFRTLESFLIDKVKNHFTKDSLPIQSGLNIPRIVFYYTDYLLWKLYFENIRGEKSEIPNKFGLKLEALIKRIEKVLSTFDSFNFRNFTSIEHLYPQNPDNGNRIEDESLNSLGNLCLISRSANSKYSNLEAIAKKEHSKNKRLNESLKQAVMFETFSGNEWGVTEIKEHETEIRSLIEYYTKEYFSES